MLAGITFAWFAGPAFRDPRVVAFIASLMLLVYVTAALMIFRREVSFLKNVEPRKRRLFICQDVLLQVSVLLVLVPLIVQPNLFGVSRDGSIGYTKEQLVTLSLVVAGFTLLWASALWMLFARYWHTREMLKELQQQEAEKLKDLEALLAKSGESEVQDDAG